jgi:hypothetical protein
MPADRSRAEPPSVPTMDHDTGTIGRRDGGPTGGRANREIDRLLARIRRLVQTREARRLEGAGDAEIASSSAEIRRLQARLADAVRRQLATGDERPAPRGADR